MPAGRHPRSLAQHSAPAGLLLMLWSFFKPFRDGDPSTCLGNLSWTAPPSQGGGFPKSPTRIYKAVLGAHSSREGGHCLRLFGQRTFLGHNQHEMALLGQWHCVWVPLKLHRCVCWQMCTSRCSDGRLLLSIAHHCFPLLNLQELPL